MATHSSTLAWKISWKEEPGGLQSMGSLRVGHYWATSLSLFTFMHWRRKWQPTPVFLPGESQGWGSLVGCQGWGRTESDMTEATQQQKKNGGSDGKGSACNAGDLGLIPGLERSPGGGHSKLSTILAWRIPWTKEPGGLQFMGLQRVGHNWATKHNTAQESEPKKRHSCWQLCLHVNT